MENVFCFLNFILFSVLILTINSQITESHKQRIKACMTLQEKKFEENEQKINEFINNKSDIYKRNPNKIILLAMAYCYDKMSVDLAKKINKIKFKSLIVEELGIKDIYDFEKYNYDDQERNSKIYDNFIPAFNAVFKEIKENEKRISESKFHIYFIHTKLFKFFYYYTIINCIIVFYIRLKDPSKYIDTTINYDKKNKKNKEDEEDDDSIDENANTNKENDKDKTNNSKNNDNFRKLKKKNRLGKIKKN